MRKPRKRPQHSIQYDNIWEERTEII